MFVYAVLCSCVAEGAKPLQTCRSRNWAWSRWFAWWNGCSIASTTPPRLYRPWSSWRRVLGFARSRMWRSMPRDSSALAWLSSARRFNRLWVFLPPLILILDLCCYAFQIPLQDVKNTSYGYCNCQLLKRFFVNTIGLILFWNWIMLLRMKKISFFLLNNGVAMFLWWHLFFNLLLIYLGHSVVTLFWIAIAFKLKCGC